MSDNLVILCGHLGQDPEIKALPDGSKFANLSIATSESWKDKTTGEKKERTQWHRIVCWNPFITTSIEKFLAKGDQIYIHGQLETRKWEDKDGVAKYATEVVLRPYTGYMKITRSKKLEKARQSGDYGGEQSPDAGVKTAGAKPAAAPAGGKRDTMDDEIPF